MICRSCKSSVEDTILDLGAAPLSNSYLSKDSLMASEIWYPLQVKLCQQCWLVQVGENVDRQLMFNNTYAYFSSTSSSFVEHARDYVNKVQQRFDLDQGSLVVEVASNDGYLLQFFKDKAIPCYGIEPTLSTAQAAIDKHSLDVVIDFFGESLADDLAANGRSVDLLVANNVLAHVPDICDFVRGIAKILKPDGVATVEFPSVKELVLNNMFDTVYHEHYSYLSLTVVEALARSYGLRVFDVDELAVHGGSLRVYLTPESNGQIKTENVVSELLQEEDSAGIKSRQFYSALQQAANRCKDDLLSFLVEAKRNGKTVAAYGAAAKGNTFLNYAGIRADLVQFVVDKSPSKQSMYMPGSRIPIVSPDEIAACKPDYLLILPWNIAEEIVAQEARIADWGGRFLTAVPKLEIHEPK